MKISIPFFENISYRNYYYLIDERKKKHKFENFITKVLTKI